jgi:CDP-diacylglycerol--glycerol-3-phosphate 3-phosphatidyltransferase
VSFRTTLPTRLTFLRLLLTPFGALFLLVEDIPSHFLWALVIFVVAAVTDFLDGYLSRKFNAVTAFGAHLDIIADKFLIVTYLCVLQAKGIYPLWLLVFLLLREMVVLGYLVFAARETKPVPVVFAAKLKMAVQGLSIPLGLIALWAEGTGYIGRALLLRQWSLWTMVIALCLGVVFSPKRLPRSISTLLRNGRIT